MIFKTNQISNGVKKITPILKEHKWAILLALVASVIIAFPQLYLRYDNANVYQGVEVLGGIGDERAWLSRVREAYDGHPLISNAYFKEGKNDPYLFQPLGSAVIASLGKLFSLDINNTILLSRFLLPFVIFLLIYGFLLFFTKEKLVALATSSFLFLGNNIFSRQGLFRILEGEPPSPYYLSYTRPVNPLMTHFFFYGFLLCFLLFLERKQWRWGILSTLLLGFSFYDFFYTWTFLYSFLGVLVLIFLFQRKWLEIKRIGLVLLGASIIAIPYLLNLYRATTSPAYQEVSQRVGVIETHTPFLSLLPVALFIIFLLFFPRGWRERYYVALALVVTPLIVLNQQIITGKILQIDKYHWFYHLPLAMIILSVIFFFWIFKIDPVRKGVGLCSSSFKCLGLSNGVSWPMLKKTLAVLIIIISVATGLWVQSSSYVDNKELVIDRQRYGATLNWLQQNAEKEEVVFSDNETSRLIVIYTPLNVFYHSSARYSLAATKERLVNALFLYYRLDGLGGSEAQEVFFRDRDYVSFAIYGMYYRDLTGSHENIPDEIIFDLAKKYQESLIVDNSAFFKAMLEKYQVKYLLWDKRDYSLWNLDQYQFLKKVAELGDFTIYQL